MANTGQPNSGGSQFFICTGTDAATLNSTPIYTQFGQVTEGMDVVLKIAAVPVTLDRMGTRANRSIRRSSTPSPSRNPDHPASKPKIYNLF